MDVGWASKITGIVLPTFSSQFKEVYITLAVFVCLFVVYEGNEAAPKKDRQKGKSDFYVALDLESQVTQHSLIRMDRCEVTLQGRR